MGIRIEFGRRELPIGLPTLEEADGILKEAREAAGTAATDAVAAAQPQIEATTQQAAQAAVAAAEGQIAAARQAAEDAASTATQAAQTAAHDAAALAAPVAAEAVRVQVGADADRAEAAADGLAAQANDVVELKAGQRKVRTLNGVTPKMLDGQSVILWEKDGGLHGPGLADGALLDRAVADVSGLKMVTRPVRSVAGVTPKIIDSGAVVAWEKGGKWFGPAVGGTSGTDMEAVRDYAEPRRSPRSSSLPIFTDGRDLWLYRLMLGQVDEATLRLVINGDSWAGMNVFATALRDMFAADHTIGGAGWWSAIAGPRFGPGGYSRPGSWTEMDVTNTASAVPNALTWGSGIDGHMLTTTGTDAQAIFTNFAASEFRIFSRNHGGTWRYLLNGAAPVVVNDSNDGALKVTVLTGLNPEGGNNLTIDTVGNAGRVSLGGNHLSKPGAGVEILQSGNGGSMGLHWSLIAPNIPAIAENLQPHAVLTFLGTNDYRYVAGVNSYIQGLRDMRDAYRSVIPDIGFIFVAPARSAGIPLMTPQVQLRDALYEFCISEGHEFYNMYDDWPDYATANARGMWTDTAHPSMAGYRSAASRIYNQFLRT